METDTHSITILAPQAQAGAEPKETPPRPPNCRRFIRRKVAYSMPDIVNAYLLKAKDGSIPHLSFLCELGGFDRKPIAAAPPKRRGKSLARQLLDEVEEQEAKNLALYGPDEF